MPSVRESGGLDMTSIREFFADNFAGDLEYHPRRAAVYFALAVGAFCFWYFSPEGAKFTVTPLVFGLGGISLLVKGIFLMRKSSEGLGLSYQDIEKLKQQKKALPSLPAQASQVVQDFGTGSFLLWPLLREGQNFNQAWSDPPTWRVFLTGAALFVVGWLVRKGFSQS